VSVQWVAVVAGALTIVGMFELLRRQHVKEKYVVLWVFAAFAIAVLALFPRLLDVVASALNIASGPNLLFLIVLIVLGLVCVHLSVAVSRLEEQNRTLAEEIGLLRFALTKSDEPRPKIS
jgi:hypothetical protein